tara:strand:- start:341 stop:724 length:384 start_codon:yes stop_codon:yes gene_type:complete
MIKDFLIISCIGKNNSIGLRINSNFFIQKIQTNTNNKDKLISNICSFLDKNKATMDENFSVIVNIGPGSFSGIRIALSIGKGIKISKKSALYGYKDSNLSELNLKNIEFLIKNNLLENKLLKPIYMV